MTRRWHVEIVVVVESDDPHAHDMAMDTANDLASKVGGMVNRLTELPAPEPV